MNRLLAPRECGVGAEQLVPLLSAKLAAMPSGEIAM